MGYFDRHPMGGDLPMDAKGRLTALLFTQEEMDNDAEFNDELYKERLVAKLEEATEIPYDEGQKFVLPFTIAELHIKIEDKELSSKIKGMIGDGGAALRGYDSVVAITNDYTSTYNGFDSPLDYANQLRDMWDDLMTGKQEFEALGRLVGLFEKISNHFGPINIK